MNSYETKVCTKITSSSIVLDKFVYDENRSVVVDLAKDPVTKKRFPVLKQIQYNETDNKTLTYKFIKLITCGGNGCIMKYSNVDDDNDSVALKVTNDSSEVEMIRTLDSCLTCTDDFDSCDVVQARYFGKHGIYHFILLPLMDGSLDSADLDEWTYKLQLQFISFITSEFSCLYRKGMLYKDVKLQNLLYKCVNKDVLEIVLGDIGSITQLDDPGAVTYPYCMRTTNNTSAIDVVWGICVMWCMLYDNDSKKIDEMWYHENINELQPTRDESDFKKRFEEFREKMLTQVNATERIIDKVNSERKTNEKDDENEFNIIKKFILGYMKNMITTKYPDVKYSETLHRYPTRSKDPLNMLDLFTIGLVELMEKLYIKNPGPKVKNKEAVGMFLKINKAKDNLTLDELTKTLVKKNEYKYLPYVFKKGATQKKEYIDYAIKNGLFNTAVNLINSYDKDKLDRICQNPHYRSYIEDVRVCAKYLESGREREGRKRDEPASASGRGAGGAEGAAEGQREGDDARSKKIRTAAASDSGDDKEGWCTII
jgi:hypothetical protein